MLLFLIHAVETLSHQFLRGSVDRATLLKTYMSAVPHNAFREVDEVQAALVWSLLVGYVIRTGIWAVQ